MRENALSSSAMVRVRSWAIGLASGALVLYASTAARVVLGGDDGEFAALGAVGGVAHPPGYPLYVLILRAFSWVPASSAAHRAGLVTAMLGALAVAGVFGACRAWKASVASSAVVAAAFAVCPRAWIASTQAEVFALNALVAAALVGLSGTDRVRGIRRCALLALALGLGLSNHHSIVLLAPVGLFGFVRGVRESDRRGAAMLVPLGALLVGLLPYAYVVWCSRHVDGRIVFGDARDLEGLIRHFRRAQYGTTQLGLRQTAHRPFAQIAFLLADVLRDLLALPIVALVGAIVAWRRDRRIDWKNGWILLFASFVLAGPIFVALFPLDTKGIDRLVVERFHLLPLVALAPLVALGIDRTFGAKMEAKLVAVAAPICVAFAGALGSLVDVVEHHGEGVQAWMQDVLRALPPNSIVVGTGDHRLGAMLYARATHLRDDVEYLDAMLLLDDGYRRRESERLGMTLVPPQNGSLSTPILAAQLLSTRRPLFLANVVSPAIPRAFPTYPIGPLVRVLPPGEPIPDPIALMQENERFLEISSLTKVVVTPGAWDDDLRASYARPFLVLAAAFDARGDATRANECRAIAGSLANAAD